VLEKVGLSGKELMLLEPILLALELLQGGGEDPSVADKTTSPA
jgi:hypothetical protein